MKVSNGANISSLMLPSRTSKRIRSSYLKNNRKRTWRMIFQIPIEIQSDRFIRCTVEARSMIKPSSVLSNRPQSYNTIRSNKSIKNPKKSIIKCNLNNRIKCQFKKKHSIITKSFSMISSTNALRISKEIMKSSHQR